MTGLTILQVLPALEGGGVERDVVNKSAGIVRAGGRSLVASAGGRMEGLIGEGGGRHIRLGLRTRNPWRMWRNAVALERVIREEGVDIVHAHSRAPAWSALAAARRTGVGFVTTYHSPYGERPKAKRFYNGVMARGDVVLTISRFISRLVQARHRVDSRRIRLVPHGVDTVAFDPARIDAPRRAALRETWDVPHGVPLIVLPGRLARWKGHAVAVEACARMRHSKAALVLVGPVAGREAYVAELKGLAKRLGVANRLHVVGPCADMPAALAVADVVVNTSTLPEGFGMVVIEAQAMGRPVVGTDHGGAAETIEPGVTGWLVRPGNAAALADRLDAVLGMEAAGSAALGQRARAAVVRDYSLAAMEAATMDAYAEVQTMRRARKAAAKVPSSSTSSAPPMGTP